MSDMTSEIRQAVTEAIKQLEGRLHLIGNVIVDDTADLTVERGMYDRRDFLNGIDYDVRADTSFLELQVGSHAAHTPYVLGGKVPSWTPIEPLKGWVERKKLDWTNKKTGKALSIDEMAWMIARKIKREGISARNVFAEVLEKRKDWIIKTLEEYGYDRHD